jgi:putative hydrolase of the HAD superfamily
MLKVYTDKKICKPKAIIFDTDNTLYHYEPAHKAAMDAVLHKAKKLLSVEGDEFIKIFDFSRNEIKLQLGETASSHSRLLYFQRTIENLGMGTRIFLALDFEQTYWREFLVNARLYPGIREFLQQLKSTEIKTANITDLTAQIQFRKMVYFGLDEFFDFVVTSEEAGCDKPDIRPFTLALKKLKVSPEDVWMIGDSIACDVVGAKEANLVSFQMKNYSVQSKLDRKIMPDVRFDSYVDLMNFFDEL